MSKLATVQALSDSAPQPERLRTVMEVQKQFEELRQTLLSWTQGFSELQSAHRQQMIDMAVLLEPIVPALAQIHQKQQEQDKRLAKLEAGVSRVTTALPSLVPKDKDGRQVQPRLASKDDLAGLPSKVWEAKPGMFSKL